MSCELELEVSKDLAELIREDRGAQWTTPARTPAPRHVIGRGCKEFHPATGPHRQCAGGALGESLQAQWLGELGATAGVPQPEVAFLTKI